MKLKNIFKFASIAVASASLMGVTSCNYLDVVPPEQAGLSDAMKNNSTALGFLYSCYNAMTQRDFKPRDYRSTINSGTDEFMLPESWLANEGAPAYSILRNTQTTTAPSTYDAAFWDTYYDGIGQTLLFERELDGEGAKNEVWTDEIQYKQWKAESRFCRAVYHFRLLSLYGPIPLTYELIDQDADPGSYPGRTHFDGCVDWIANELDMAAEDLPAIRENTGEYNRATQVMCKAIKARLLLYAASDLWNGNFPTAYRSWAQSGNKWNSTNPVTGESYGKALAYIGEVRESRWQEALDACMEAYQVAVENGYELFDAGEFTEFDGVEPSEIWVPDLDYIIETLNTAGVKVADPEAEDATELTEFDPDAFKRAVWYLRLLNTTTYNEGNHEIIWAENDVVYGRLDSRLPRNILTTSSNSSVIEGWSGVAPTLYTVEHFLNADGTIPGQGGAKCFGLSSSAFYKDGYFTETERTRIANICRNREPRFYAWIGFDGGDYLTQLVDGEPLVLNMRKPELQGRKLTERNYSATGFVSMKHVDPALSYTLSNGTQTSGKESPEVFMRFAELILNIAECAAEMSVHGFSPSADGAFSQSDWAGKDMEDVAIEFVNMIRARAYVAPLEKDKINFTEQLTSNGESKTWNIVEWVRNERFVEFWDEGQRYFDVRRWVAGDEYFGYGKRRGLNALIENPGSDFLTTRNLNAQFSFHYRQYLYPIYVDQVYKNTQMVQNPGF